MEENEPPASLEKSETSVNQEPGVSGAGGAMVVAIGASAGGVEALQELFSGMPVETGLTFVVILHTTADPDSHLAEIIQRKTSIPVTAVRNSAKLKINHIYCLPSDREVELLDGEVLVTDRTLSDDRRVPIDLFFRSVAGTYKERTISIILSGTGSDGSLGTGRVREEGGVNIVQDPSQAEYAVMPRNAIEHGSVDFILPLEQIPAKLVSLQRNAERIQLPPAEGPVEGSEEALIEILALLRARTRHDFVNYKRSTVLRRIERRMQITECEDLAAYLMHLRQHPEEVRGLLRDLLISVTNFFRDGQAFQHLQSEIVPRLFEEMKTGDQLRVWVPGCATGEEAYSHAMILSEYADTLSHPPSVQIFATDIDEEALSHGRQGIYTTAIAADVSPQRLKRFFSNEGLSYRVKRELREMVLFAPQNLLRDPPFSKLNLISCRNLLIYIDRQAQERLLETFHFALRSGGYLFLGSSESADGLSSGFSTIHKKSRIFQRDKSASVIGVPPPSAAPTGWAAVPPSQLSPPIPAIARGVVPSFAELHYRMLEAFGPPSVLIDANYEIVHISEHAGHYLQMSGGEPSRNLLRAAHPSLQLELRSLLIEGSQVGQASRLVVANIDDQEALVEVSVRSLSGTKALSGFSLVLFEAKEQSTRPAPKKTPPTEGDANAVLLNVEEQLWQARDQLRATSEEYETSTEELKATNEELQAMNEELRSASEELETGKEELQSLNEELTTLNAELKEKVEEVSLANSDLQNLMASTRIATLFVDRATCVKRYTPSLQEIFNIIPTDVGRPLAHLTHNLTSNNLTADVQKVLEDLQTMEREVSTKDGRWFILRLLPYRTTDDKITGVVVTFTDIQERKNAEEALRSREERLQLLVESSLDYAIMTLDAQGNFVSWNPAAAHIFGYSPGEIIGQPFQTIFTVEDKAAGKDKMELSTAEQKGKSADERWHVRKDGTRLYLSGVLVLINDKSGKGFAKIGRDLTAEHNAKTELAQAKQELEVRVRERTEQLASANSQLREEIREHALVEQQRLDLVRRIVGTQEEERRRISRELHDQLGQLLTALRLRLENLQESTDPRKTSQIAQELVESTKQLEAEIDFLAWELRPTMLDDFGLQPTLENYVRQWSEHTGIPATFHGQALGNRRLTWLLETNLYRIAQEALNNIAKHSGATKAEIVLELQEANVVLIIEDNGRGFASEDKPVPGGRDLGLAGIRERTKLMNGTIEIESADGKGAALFVKIPAQNAADDGNSNK